MRTAIIAANTAGAPLLTTWETAVDTLICGQSAGGTWAAKDVEFLTVAPTPALANLNLVSASFPLVPQSGTTFAANAGLTGSQTATGYADVGYSAATGQMTITSGLLGVCVLNSRASSLSTFAADVGVQMSGSSTASNISILSGSSGANTNTFALGGAQSTVSSGIIPNTLGGFWTTRQGSSLLAYSSGTQVLTITSCPTSLPTGFDFFVLALDVSGVPVSGKGLPDTVGAVVLGAGETGAQVQADEVLFTNALHAMGVSSGC